MCYMGVNYFVLFFRYYIRNWSRDIAVSHSFKIWLNVCNYIPHGAKLLCLFIWNIFFDWKLIFFLNVLNIGHFELFLAHLTQIVMWSIATTWHLSSKVLHLNLRLWHLWANWNKFGRNVHLMVLFKVFFTPIHNRKKEAQRGHIWCFHTYGYT